MFPYSRWLIILPIFRRQVKPPTRTSTSIRRSVLSVISVFEELFSVTRLGEISPFGRIFCALGEIFFRSLFTIGRFFGQNFIYFGRIFFQVYLLLGEIFQRFGRIFFKLSGHTVRRIAFQVSTTPTLEPVSKNLSALEAFKLSVSHCFFCSLRK